MQYRILRSITLLTLLVPGIAFGQERYYEWHWQMHPMWWWGWGFGIMALMGFFWILVIIGFIVGIRWLLGKGRREKNGFRAADPSRTLRARRDQQGRVRNQEKRSFVVRRMWGEPIAV